MFETEEKFRDFISDVRGVGQRRAERCVLLLVHLVKHNSKVTPGKRCSGILIKSGDATRIVTAAHCVEDFQAEASQFESCGVLIYWKGLGGKTAATVRTLNFAECEDFVLSSRLVRTEGYDFAVVDIATDVQAKMTGAGLVPVASCEANLTPQLNSLSTFDVSGFPLAAQWGAHADFVSVPVEKVAWEPRLRDPNGPAGNEDPRFLGRIHQEFAKEMPLPGASGGLIFACDFGEVPNASTVPASIEILRVDQRNIGVQFRPIGVQSKWWKPDSEENWIHAGNYLADVFKGID